MDISILTASATTEIIAGIVIGILSFLFGKNRGKKSEREKLGV
jgi:hypothetical protein